MPIIEHTTSQTLTGEHPQDALRPYWLDGAIVRYQMFEVSGADPDTFRFWAGSFACDARHVWCASKRLRGADPESFTMLNFAWARDRDHVWTLGGALATAEASSFEVCDDGVYLLPTGTPAPYGYARDHANVYYYDFNGRPVVVRKADTASFASLNDGHFARDSEHVFCHGSVLPAARLDGWSRLGGFYSTDGQRVYYYNRRIRDADAATFTVEPLRRVQLARDRSHFWRNDNEIDEAGFERQLSRSE